MSTFDDLKSKLAGMLSARDPWLSGEKLQTAASELARSGAYQLVDGAVRPVLQAREELAAAYRKHPGLVRSIASQVVETQTTPEARWRANCAAKGIDPDSAFNVPGDWIDDAILAAGRGGNHAA